MIFGTPGCKEFRESGSCKFRAEAYAGVVFLRKIIPPRPETLSRCGLADINGTPAGASARRRATRSQFRRHCRAPVHERHIAKGIASPSRKFLLLPARAGLEGRQSQGVFDLLQALEFGQLARGILLASGAAVRLRKVVVDLGVA